MNRIKEARQAAKMSQKYVAITLGLAAPSVSNWESGKTTPTPENYAALAQLFDVSVDYLLGIDDVPKQKKPASESELDLILTEWMLDLTPEEWQRVRDFAEGLKASRKAKVSPHK